MALASALPTRLPQTSGAGGTYYVDQTGSTGSDARSAATAQNPATPWATIRHALDSVPAGSFIKVLPGTIPISVGGLGSQAIYCYQRLFGSADPVTVMPNVPGTVTIQCTQVNNSWGGWVYQSSGLRIQGFTFSPIVDASSQSQFFQSNLVIEDSSRIEVTDCIFTESGEKGILIKGGSVGSGRSSDDIWIYGNTFRPKGSDPFAYVSGCDFPAGTYYGSRGSHFLYIGGWGANPASSWEETNGTKRAVVANNVFVGSTKGRHVELGPEARDGFVVNNTFYGNHNIQKYGINTVINTFAAHDQSGMGVIQYANATAQGFKSGNNVIANNVFCDLDGNAATAGTPGGSGAFDASLVTKNLAYQCRNCYGFAGSSSADYQDLSLGVGASQFTVTANFPAADPLFTDPANFDYRLQTGSPALAVADPQYAPLTDRLGTARDPNTPSLGAYDVSSGISSGGSGGAGGTSTLNGVLSTNGRITGVANAAYASVVASGTDTSGAALDIIRWLSGGTFNIYNSLLGFDTSAIPDNATIISAVLRLYVTTNNNADARSLVGEYFDYGAGLDTADWTHDAPGSPAMSVLLSSFGINGYTDFAFTDLTGVSKTGLTKIRLSISGGQPTGVNWVSAHSSRGANTPLLVVTYSVPTGGGVGSGSTQSPITAAFQWFRRKVRKKG